MAGTNGHRPQPTELVASEVAEAIATGDIEHLVGTALHFAWDHQDTGTGILFALFVIAAKSHCSVCEHL